MMTNNGWKPASTAPTDGTRFDAWCVPPGGGRGVRLTDVLMRGDESGFGFIIHLKDRVYWQYLDARDEDSIYPKWVMTHWIDIPDEPEHDFDAIVANFMDVVGVLTDDEFQYIVSQVETKRKGI